MSLDNLLVHTQKPTWKRGNLTLLPMDNQALYIKKLTPGHTSHIVWVHVPDIRHFGTREIPIIFTINNPLDNTFIQLARTEGLLADSLPSPSVYCEQQRQRTLSFS
jgi:hypothetical protein